jgi:hypothetical protein
VRTALRMVPFPPTGLLARNNFLLARDPGGTVKGVARSVRRRGFHAMPDLPARARGCFALQLPTRGLVTSHGALVQFARSYQAVKTESPSKGKSAPPNRADQAWLLNDHTLGRKEPEKYPEG